MLRDLINHGFLVENDADELSEIEAAHREARQSREQLDLVIAPSMACNLDCPYCFETNRYAGRMSGEVQDNVIGLVRRSFDGGAQRLTVTWYGGEPLLAFSVIERMSRRFLALCDALGREYSAEIVTNGTLMTGEKAERLAALKVKRAQITLDGSPDLHDARRVGRTHSPTFYRILEGIESALAHIQVAIRVNVCRAVAARLEELLQILAARGLNRTVSVYVAPLQEARGRNAPRRESGDCVQLPVANGGSAELDLLSSEEAADLELRFDELLWKYGFSIPDRLPRPRGTTCVADKDQGWLIEANGNIQKCYWTAGFASEAVGRLSADGIAATSPYGKWQDWMAQRNAECGRCIMLPLCLGRCPLKHLNNETDFCPPTKYNWIRCLGRAAGVADGRLAAVRLPLGGAEISKLRGCDLAVELNARENGSEIVDPKGSP